jgi:general stress protein YciG
MANTSKRGFASMDASKQREIASKGGRAAHAKGTAHEFTSDEARVAGRKGGEAVSRDRAHMSAIGREGGHSRGARARAAASSGDSSGMNRTDTPGSFDAPSGRAGASAGSFGTQERGNSAPRGDSRNDRSNHDRGESGNGSFN